MTKPNQRRLARILLIAAGALLLLTGAVTLCPRPAANPTTAAAGPAALSDDARLDLNTACAEELLCLPGIGPVKAEAILARRDELGGFRTREDILSVPGLGEVTLAGIEPYITLETRSSP